MKHGSYPDCLLPESLGVTHHVWCCGRGHQTWWCCSRRRQERVLVGMLVLVHVLVHMSLLAEVRRGANRHAGVVRRQETVVELLPKQLLLVLCLLLLLLWGGWLLRIGRGRRRLRLWSTLCWENK